MQHKAGRSLAMQGGNPMATHLKAHGVKNAVQPLGGDLLIGMKEDWTQQKARQATAVHTLSCQQNGGGTIKNGSASHWTQPVGM